jgi:hypothetical protein
MTADPILTLALLVLAHLVADFLLQTTSVVAAKTAKGGRAWRGMFDHAAGVTVCLIPVALAFGGWGVVAVAVIVLSHVVIDRVKIVATRRTEASALAEARRRHEGSAPASALGRAWTPAPAAWFVLDQLAHLAVIAFVWSVWLAGTPLSSGWHSAVATATGGWDPAALHEAVLIGVVLVALAIANIRAGAILVATLVRPLELGDELGTIRASADAYPAADQADVLGAMAGSRSNRSPRAGGPGWTIRLGPLSGRVVADPVQPATSNGEADILGERVALPPPARVGATIGILERLLIATFVLVGAEAAIGFVIAAKTLARFRLLDDRDFAEYYLLGTLASVSVAIITALVARVALSA